MCTEVFGTVADWVVAFAAAGAAVAAFLGLSTWRKQLSGEMEHKVARRLLRDVYFLRDVIESVRRPMMNFPEMTNALEKEGRDDALHESEAAAYRERSKELQSSLATLYPDYVEAETLWGPAIRSALDDLRQCVKDLIFAIDDHIHHLRDPHSELAVDALLEETRAVLCARSRQPDEFAQRVEKSIAAVDKVVRPRLLTIPMRSAAR